LTARSVSLREDRAAAAADSAPTSGLPVRIVWREEERRARRPVGVCANMARAPARASAAAAAGAPPPSASLLPGSAGSGRSGFETTWSAGPARYRWPAGSGPPCCDACLSTACGTCLSGLPAAKSSLLRGLCGDGENPARTPPLVPDGPVVASGRPRDGNCVTCVRSVAADCVGDCILSLVWTRRRQRTSKTATMATATTNSMAPTPPATPGTQLPAAAGADAGAAAAVAGGGGTRALPRTATGAAPRRLSSKSCSTDSRIGPPAATATAASHPARPAGGCPGAVAAVACARRVKFTSPLQPAPPSGGSSIGCSASDTE